MRVERTGEITVLTGSSSHGQGHETSWAQIAAELLKTRMDHVTVLHGDTHVSQQGTGTFGSRSAVVGGGALATAAERVIEKAKRIAAHLVEAAPEDIVQADGGFAVKGVPDKKSPGARSPLRPTAAECRKGMEIGLQETAFFDPKREAWGFGTHVASVSIDRDTGKLTIEKLVLVDDCGVVINPMIVEGQIHGGVAQGLGEALREQMLYSEDGQVQTGTLMNYAVMRAADMPPMILGETITPNPFQSAGRQRRRRMRHQRRAAGGRQRGDGRARAARHRSYRHALHRAEVVGSDSKGEGEELGNRHEATGNSKKKRAAYFPAALFVFSFPKSSPVGLNHHAARPLTFLALVDYFEASVMPPKKLEEIGHAQTHDSASSFLDFSCLDRSTSTNHRPRQSCRQLSEQIDHQLSDPGNRSKKRLLSERKLERQRCLHARRHRHQSAPHRRRRLRHRQHDGGHGIRRRRAAARGV